jgi:hypothetical protein
MCGWTSKCMDEPQKYYAEQKSIDKRSISLMYNINKAREMKAD